MAVPLIGIVAAPKQLLADKTYDAEKPAQLAEAEEEQAVIPSTAARRTPYPLDRKAYRRRNGIERLFCELRNWRRIETQIDRHAQNYLSALALAESWLGFFEQPVGYG